MPILSSTSASLSLNHIFPSSHVHMDILFVANCSDPRMSQIVIHGGIVYLSGQVDQEATDAEGQTNGEVHVDANRPKQNPVGRNIKIRQGDVGTNRDPSR